jgi:hypothetical protein
MFRNVRKIKGLWFANALLSLGVALIGVLDNRIYSKVVSQDVLPGVISQDLQTIAAGLLLLALTLRMSPRDIRRHVIGLGIVGYLFYAYGIYAIEQIYNYLYFVYLAIFGLSLYTIIYSLANLDPDKLNMVVLGERIRKVSVGFSLFVAVFFSLLWILMLVPLIERGEKIESMYSIFILDLSFIMPAFFILAILSAKKQGFGLLMTPALYVLGFTLLFPVGMAEFIKPFFELPVDPSGAVLYLGISALFLLVAFIYLRRLEFKVGNQVVGISSNPVDMEAS